jgi:hypothetical protein
LLGAVKAQGVANVEAALDRYGPDAMLLDTGPAMLGTGQGLARSSDEAGSVMGTALKGRDQATKARMQSDVNAVVGPAEDPQTVLDTILAHRKAVDNVAYPAALDHAPPVSVAPILTQLDNAIPRASDMERRALENLRDQLMTTERRPVAGAFGLRRFQDVPVPQNDATLLHNVKQGLDNVIDRNAPGLGVPAGALQNQQGVLKWFRFQLNHALENQVPGYAEANATSQALADRAAAVQRGTEYLGLGKNLGNTTPSPARFAAEFEALSPGEKIALAKGSRGTIDRIFGTQGNDLGAVKGALQGEGDWNTANLATVHGQDAADQLVSSLDRNIKFRDTYHKVGGDAQEAQRQAAANAMTPQPSGQAPLINPNMTLTGLAGTATKNAATALANALFRKDPAESYAEVARILSAQGPDARAYLDALKDTLNRQSAVAPRLNLLGDRAALAAAIVGGRFLRGQFAGTPSNK